MNLTLVKLPATPTRPHLSREPPVPCSAPGAPYRLLLKSTRESSAS